MRNRFLCFVVFALGLLFPSPVAAGDVVSTPGLSPGSVLTRDGDRVVREAVLPPELAARVAQGELEIRVGEAVGLPPTQAYLEATEKYSGQVVLREDGSLDGYVAGQPFPMLSPDDPRCGTKAAWNFRHHDTGRGLDVQGVLRQFSAPGSLLREMEFAYSRAYGMHVAGEAEDRWEGEGVLYKEFYRILAPLNVQNVMNLRFRYDDDDSVDETWVYAPSERRIRKTVQPQDEPTLGSDVLREDYYGFSGYLRAHDWRCIGEGVVLAPVGIPSPRATIDPKRYYPLDPWRPRHVLIVEAVPKEPAHPYGRRVLYIDREKFVSLYVLISDPEGAHAKTLFSLYADPRFVPGQEKVRAPVWLAEVMIDHRSGGATIIEVTEGRFDVALPEEHFGIDRMMALGR